MPGQPFTLVKQGCFDADLMNQVNANLTAQDSIVGVTVNNPAVPFGNYTTTGTAITLLPAGHPPGTYTILIFAVITTTFVTAASVGHTVGWTDDQGAHTQANNLGALTAGTFLSSEFLFRSTGAAALTLTEIAGTSNATAGAMALSAVLQRVI